jgi:hypothetical protein
MAGSLNRVVELYKNWEIEEAQLKQLSGLQPDPKDILKAKYEFLSNGVYRIGINPGVGEHLALKVMRGSLAKIEKKLYANVFLRAAHTLKVVLIDKPNYIDQFLKFKEENLQQMENLLKSRGLNHYNGKLEQYLDFERPQVNMNIPASLNKDTHVNFVVRMEKSSDGGYEMESTRVEIAYVGQPEKSRHFDFDRDLDLSAVKMTNLMMGRAVANGKDDLAPWVQLENAGDPNNQGIKVFQAAHGFELERVLSEFAGETGIYRATAADFVKGLNRGDQMKLTGRHPLDQPVFIEASPGTNGIIIRDLKQNVIGVDEVFLGTKQAREKELANQLLVSKSQSKNNQQDQSFGLGS